MAVKQLPKLSELPEPPDRLVGDQERFDVLTFNSLKAQKKMVNDDLNKTFIPKLNEFAVDVNASVDAAAQSERNAAAAATTAGNKANEAASSATTAGTKAGEASKSAAAAKTSETNAAASKTAAAKSATDAQAAQRGAEAARDEAQDLANVGYASDAKAGLAKVDGKTTQAAADGAITVKDVAIGGDLGDLASARGFFYDKYVPWYAGTPADTYLITDFNEFKKPGRYHIRWREGTPASTGEEVTANNPNLGNGAGGWFDAILEIDGLSPASHVTNNARIVQRVIVTNTVNNQNSRIASRLQAGNTWYPWKVTTLNSDFGDGLRITNYKISVPEMEGATASANGTAGLVPPATAGQQESFLTGGGEYKPALSTSGGTITGELNIAAPAGSSEGGEITLINGTDGKYPAKIDTTRNLIRFFGGPSNPVSVDLETGRFVGNLTGKADTAGIADNSLAFANGRRWVEVTYEGNPGWLIGSVGEQLQPINPLALSVKYANSAGYANARFLNVFSFATANTGVNLPAGGSWLVFAQWYSYGGEYWEVSGKQDPWIDYRAGGSRIEEKRLGFALRIS